MSEVGEMEAKKSSLWDKSPLSPQWTAAAVLMLIIFLGVLVKIISST